MLGDFLDFAHLEVPVARPRVEHVLVEDRVVMVVAVGPELLDQAQPGRGIDEQVGEDVILERVDHFRHRMGGIIEPVLLQHLRAQLLGHDPARGLALGHCGPLAHHRAIGHQHHVEQLLLGEVSGRGGAGRRHRAQVTADVIGEDVVLHVLVAHDVRHLGMDVRRVIGLHESFERDFPVGRQVFAHMGCHVPPGQVPVGEMIGQDFEIVGQRGRLRVEVHEHHAIPAFDADLRKAGLLPVDLREFEAARDVLQRAVESPFPAMKRAAYGR